LSINLWDPGGPKSQQPEDRSHLLSPQKPGLFQERGQVTQFG